MPRFIKQKHVSLYKKYVLGVIKDLASNVIFFVSGAKTECTNCYYDAIKKCSSGRYKTGGTKQFTNGSICPVCNGKGMLSSNDENSVVPCTVKWVNYGDKDYDSNLTVAGGDKKGYFKVKANISYKEAIESAEYATIEGYRCKRISSISRGLKDKIVIEAYFSIEE